MQAGTRPDPDGSGHEGEGPVTFPGWRVLETASLTTGTALLARVAREGWSSCVCDGREAAAPGPVLLFEKTPGSHQSRQILACLMRIKGAGGVAVTSLERNQTGPDGTVMTDAVLMDRLAVWLGRVGEPGMALSSRQTECLALLAQGLRVREIAETLCVSQSAVEQYLRAARDRLGARSRAEAVVLALRRGLLIQGAGRAAVRAPLTEPTVQGASSRPVVLGEADDGQARARETGGRTPDGVGETES